jgi:acetoacetate decarboxylase
MKASEVRETAYSMPLTSGLSQGSLSFCKPRIPRITYRTDPEKLRADKVIE